MSSFATKTIAKTIKTTAFAKQRAKLAKFKKPMTKTQQQAMFERLRGVSCTVEKEREIYANPDPLPQLAAKFAQLKLERELPTSVEIKEAHKKTLMNQYKRSIDIVEVAKVISGPDDWMATLEGLDLKRKAVCAQVNAVKKQMVAEHFGMN